MLSIGDGLVLAQDSATAACAGGNAAYFAFYLQRTATLVRRLSAAILALLNLGIFVERVYAIDLYLATQRGMASSADPEAMSWLLAHLLLFLGTTGTTALIARQLLNH